MWFQSEGSCKITNIPSREELGPSGSLTFVENRQGLQLCRYLWPVESPIGVVFCVHGFGSHAGSLLLKRNQSEEGGKYANSLVELFNRRGYSVASMDLQGCGRSDGFLNRRAFFYHFADLVTDLADFVHDAREADEGFSAELPTFLFGASLGGCLSVHVAHRCEGLFTGVALIAPMLSVDQIRRSGINRIYSLMAYLLNLLIPDLPLVAIPRSNKFPEIQEMWERDPAIFRGRVRVRVGFQCVKAIDWVQQNAEQFSFPYLIIHGTEDTVCDPEVRFLTLSHSDAAAIRALDNSLRSQNRWIKHSTWQITCGISSQLNPDMNKSLFSHEPLHLTLLV